MGVIVAAMMVVGLVIAYLLRLTKESAYGR